MCFHSCYISANGPHSWPVCLISFHPLRGRLAEHQTPMAETILFIGLIVFLAHFFVALFRKTKVPDVLWLTLLGLLLGPVTHEVRPESFGQAGSVISTIALVLILFESGMTLDPLVIPSIWR